MSSRLSRITTRMGPDILNSIERMPGLGGIALYVNFNDTDEEDVVAYTDGQIVTAGPRYQGYCEPERQYIVLHELLHVALAHPVRAREMSKRVKDFDKRLFNIVGDAIINAALEGVRGIRKPSDAVCLESLLKAVDLWPENKSIAEVVRQWSVEALYHTVTRKADEILGKFGQHTHCCQPKDGSVHVQGKGEAEDAESTIRNWSARLTMARGSLAGVIARLVGDLPNVKTPWERVLRDYLHRFAQKKRHIDPSRPSRRWCALERDMLVRESITLPISYATTAARSGRLAIAVDTSMSIVEKILNQFIAEMCAIIEQIDPVIRLIVSDAEVHQVEDLSGSEGIRRLRSLKYKGGGGTDFKPAIDAAAEWKPDAMVYLTDLYGDAGEEPKFPVLWAVTPDHGVKPWGTMIQLD